MSSSKVNALEYTGSLSCAVLILGQTEGVLSVGSTKTTLTTEADWFWLLGPVGGLPIP
jgi:hypothetical protein